MKKVIIATLNSKYIHSSLAPWCLFTAAKERCSNEYDIRVIEGTINENQEKLTERIINENAAIICFSCYIWNIDKTLEICRKIKEAKKEVLIALGGPEVAYRQGDILGKYGFIDFVFSGEGEIILPEFLEEIKKGIAENIKGVSYRKDGEILVSSLPEGSCESYPSPYCKEYFQSLKGRIAYIESSRGCPFSCAFCLSGRQSGVRFFPLEKVKREILELSEKGAKTVKFVDRTFNCNLKRAKEILSFIKEHYGKEIPDDICFHFEISGEITDGEFFSLVSSMPQGSVQFEIGIQSYNKKTLQAIGRKTDLKKTEETVIRLREKGNCHIHTDLIAGLPFEDYESFKEGFNRAYALKADMLQLGFLKILHGSPMGQEREKFPCSFSESAPYEVESTPYISSEELNKLHIAENELERLYNSGRFRRTLCYVLEKTDIEPYDLFYSFGKHLKDKGRQGSMPLDEYICEAYGYFLTLKGVEQEHLRDNMLCDRIVTDNTGIIPRCLRREDSELKRVRQQVNELYPLKKGVKRTVAILYGQKRIILCDHKERNRVTGEYEASLLSM